MTAAADVLIGTLPEEELWNLLRSDDRQLCVAVWRRLLQHEKTPYDWDELEGAMASCDVGVLMADILEAHLGAPSEHTESQVELFFQSFLWASNYMRWSLAVARLVAEMQARDAAAPGVDWVAVRRNLVRLSEIPKGQLKCWSTWRLHVRSMAR